MLYLIGFGLSSPQDLTLKSLAILQRCERVFIDTYTSCAVDPSSLEVLHDMIGKPCVEADRKMVEQGTEILNAARNNDVAFLVIGDPLSATTHIDLIQRAILENISFETVNNTSIMTAAGLTGLCLYEFGRTVSIPLWDEFGEPMSYYPKIEMNLRIGTHTLCLLDIKVKEQSLNNLLRGNNIYEPARFMTCEMAAQQLLKTVSRLRERGQKPLLKESHIAIGLARVGSPEQRMAISTLETYSRSLLDGSSELTRFLGRPLHSLILLGPLQTSEMEFLLLSTSKLISEVHQPVFFLGPNHKASCADAKTMERLLLDHNNRCQEFIQAANFHPSAVSDQPAKSAAAPTSTNETVYIPQLL